MEVVVVLEMHMKVSRWSVLLSNIDGFVRVRVFSISQSCLSAQLFTKGAEPNCSDLAYSKPARVAHSHEKPRPTKRFLPQLLDFFYLSTPSLYLVGSSIAEH
jgi:hypothetical protein